MSNIILPGDQHGGRSDIDKFLQVTDATYISLYGARMVQAAEQALDAQRAWTHDKMGVEETWDPIYGKDLKKVRDSEQVPAATFGLRGRMFSKLQAAIGHMSQLKPKEDCPMPEQEMVLVAHALAHDFVVGELKKDGRGYYVQACLAPGRKVYAAGIEGEKVEAHRTANKELLDEDIRSMIGYAAVLMAARDDLREISLRGGA